MSYENHTPRKVAEEVNRVAKRGPRPDEVEKLKRWEREKRIKAQNDANEASE